MPQGRNSERCFSKYDVSAEQLCRHDAWYKRIEPRWTSPLCLS
ncbi:hypothetical protein [Escherichia coli ISC41]|uniref:Uncharacterized protein n=1 Tax=Escherichia coli ISC7 TaxID=1432555 RepID=W1EX67_ECOLX|nr:hypothetical protein [Escherichia coli ISC7]CDL46232.1 hypothetical protein [Escherichia coli ISC41]